MNELISRIQTDGVKKKKKKNLGNTTSEEFRKGEFVCWTNYRKDFYILKGFKASGIRVCFEHVNI